MTDKKQILPDSPDAAQNVTLTGWVAAGRFYGSDERTARYAGATHIYCAECRAVIEKGSWTKCWGCRTRSEAERYDAMPRIKWDGEAMLFSQTLDRYFNDIDAAGDQLEEGQKLADLCLVVCKPNYPRRVSSEDIYDDVLPEDGDVPDALDDAIEALNALIAAQPAASWSPGKYALDLATVSEPAAA